MAVVVKHAKISAVPDADNAELVQPSDWNAEHTVTGIEPAIENDSGAGAPTLADGTVGGFYVDTTARALYGLKFEPSLTLETVFVGEMVPGSYSPGSYRLANDIKVLKPGQVVGGRFFRSPTSGLTARRMTLFNRTSQALLGTSNLTTETAGFEGWVTAMFPAPIVVAANDELTMCYDETVNYVYGPAIDTPTDATHAIGLGIRYGVTNSGFPVVGSASTYNYYTDMIWEWLAAGEIWPLAVPGWVQLTQAEYDALTPKVATTMYVVVG